MPRRNRDCRLPPRTACSALFGRNHSGSGLCFAQCHTAKLSLHASCAPGFQTWRRPTPQPVQPCASPVSARQPAPPLFCLASPAPKYCAKVLRRSITPCPTPSTRNTVYSSRSKRFLINPGNLRTNKSSPNESSAKLSRKPSRLCIAISDLLRALPASSPSPLRFCAMQPLRCLPVELRHLLHSLCALPFKTGDCEKKRHHPNCGMQHTRHPKAFKPLPGYQCLLAM